MTKALNFITLFLLFGSIATVNSECFIYCYQKISINGKCNICYRDCEYSTQNGFLSCSISSQKFSSQQEISQSTCQQLCYPNGQQGIQLASEPILKVLPPIQEKKLVQISVEQQEQNKNTDTLPSEQLQNTSNKDLVSPSQKDQTQNISQDKNLNKNNENLNQQIVTTTEQTPTDQNKEPITPQESSIVSEESRDDQVISFEELKKLKKQNQGWTPPEQNILPIFCFLFVSSLLTIGGFTILWKLSERKRKLKELKKKHEKEWVKVFEKVDTSDTTMSSLDSSRDMHILPIETVQTNEKTEQTK